MEKIDILFIAFVVFVIIVSCYIAYLKAGINFLCDTLAKHESAIDGLADCMMHQANINDNQREIDKIVFDKLKINYSINLDDSPTGGVKQSN